MSSHHRCLPSLAALAVVVSLIAAACGASDPGVATPVGPPLPFTEVAEASGIRFVHELGADRPLNLTMTMAPGCALLDYDGDGDLDAFLVNGVRVGDAETGLAPGAAPTHALYRNRGDGTFEDVTAAAGLARPTRGQGCAVGDYDGDGHLDLYVTSYGANQLFRNRGDGTFEDATERSGTGDERFGVGAVFLDYDGDRDVDLYVANYVEWPEDRFPSSRPRFQGPKSFAGADDVLYRNDGDGTFTDVSREAGLVRGGRGMAVVAADLDWDGDADVFVANDTMENWFYRNDGGTFVESAVGAGLAYDGQGMSTGSMGLAVADVDGDGWQDIHLTNFRDERDNLYRNEGALFFRDVANEVGLIADAGVAVAWSTALVDLDLDGDLDAVVAHGGLWIQSAEVEEPYPFAQRDLVFVGTPDGRFARAASALDGASLAPLSSRGCAYGDVDGDGDVDLLVASCGGPARLFRNDSDVGTRWARIDLVGRAPNTEALGARVELDLGGRVVVHEVRHPVAYLSSSPTTWYVGLRDGEAFGVATVTWPSGLRSEHTVEPGRAHRWSEPGE